jgi:dTDP-4-amino-4,6-dideoxygalactose transaminase
MKNIAILKPKKSSYEFLPFALPETSDEEANEVADTILSGWLTTGPKTKKFEEAFASYCGAEYALGVNSATAGLHLALEAVGVQNGDLVITTPYTFTASAEVIRYLGADPLFVDIESKTFNIDPFLITRKIEALGLDRQRLKAIIPVHFGGQACNMLAIKEIAKIFHLPIVEDAAHALPCTYNNQAVGTIGDATAFSFYVTKTLATGEGGMVTTNSHKMAERIKVMRLHGISRDIWDRYTSDKPNWYYEVVAPGFKYNMSDIMAAIGIHQLAKVERFQKRREAIAKIYNEAFADLPLQTPYVDRTEDVHSWHLYVIKLELENIKITRDEFIQKMTDNGIGTSVHFIPLHLHPYWRDRYRLKPEDFPISLDCYQRVVSLPIYSKMNDGDVERVVAAVRRILG